jgi:hypothetical protein
VVPLTRSISPNQLKIAITLNLHQKLSKFRNTGKTYQSVVMALNPTMLMACARTATMPREEPRELIFVATQREYSMPKVYAKTAT